MLAEQVFLFRFSIENWKKQLKTATYLTKLGVSSIDLAKHPFMRIFWHDCLRIDNQRSRSRTGWSAVLLMFRGGEWSPWEQEPPEALLQSHLWRASRTRSRMRWAVWDWTPFLSSGVRRLPREGASSELSINPVIMTLTPIFYHWKTWPCISSVCQGRRRFLTISDPRWDQQISDIFI